MASARSKHFICNIVKERSLELETEDRKPRYLGVAVMKEKLLVTDSRACNLQVFNLQDGKLICTSDRLESDPYDVCVLSDTQCAVCLSRGKIVIMALTPNDGVERVKTHDVSTGFVLCHSMAKWTDDKLVVSGERRRGAMLCWAVVWIKDGRLDSTHDICEGLWTGVTVKHNTAYVLCQTLDAIANGVHAFDLLNPRHEPKSLYQHKELTKPGSIVADRGYVFVSNKNTLHQITDSGQLVAIHALSSSIYAMFYDDHHGVLYTKRYGSKVITLYKMEYPHQSGVPIEILNMDPRSIQRFEEALKGGKETVYNIQIMLVGDIGVGKTTLFNRLLGEEVNISERHSTEGIEVICCDASLLTYKWIQQLKDSEQDYKLQRLVKLLNDNYQTGGEVVGLELNASSIEREITDGNPLKHVADDDRNTKVVHHQSHQLSVCQNRSSTSSLQGEPSFPKFDSSHTQFKTKTIPGAEHAENVLTEMYKTDPLREMLKLLQRNPDKARQNVNRYARLTMLEFAAQQVFYTTYLMFLRRRAIYLLVTDTSKEVRDLIKDGFYLDSNGLTGCRGHDLVDILMSFIHSCALPDKENLNTATSHMPSSKVIPPPVILVGTHIDQTQKRNRHKHGWRYLQDIRSYLKDKPAVVHLVDEDFAIDNTVVDSELEKLKRKIIEVASQQPYWGEQIPTRWFLLEQQLMRLKKCGVKVIPRITVEDLNKKGTVQLKDSEELDVFLNYLHEIGTIMYYSIEILRDYIILDPKWLIDALMTLINGQPNPPNNPSDNDVTQKWSDFKEKGILTLELVDAIWTKKKHPELHANKHYSLMIMEQLNILARPRSFNEIGEKVEVFFITPCMLHQESPTEVIYPEQDPSKVTTPEMCFIFTDKYLPTPIFHRLLAACVARWPVAKNETSENLIFCGCCVFDLDLFHRLTLYLKGHIVSAKITRLMKDEIKTPDAKLCSRVRMFITQTLSKITSYLGLNLQYELQASYQTWHAYEGHDPEAIITREHMNHSRLCVALITVCGNAMRDVLRTYPPPPHTDIDQAILANKERLTGTQIKPILNADQMQLIFPDPHGNNSGNVDHFDFSLLYTLIRNISAVPAPEKGWGCNPQCQTMDKSVGASVERIRSYRNQIICHSMDGWINQNDFRDYWNKIDAVLGDIEQALGRKGYRAQLERQNRHVISVFEA